MARDAATAHRVGVKATEPHAVNPRVDSAKGRVVGLSIRQPWVELILSGRKSIEVRTWKTKHRGTLWLHAGQRIEATACSAHSVQSKGLVVASLVGCAELVDCIEFNRETWTSLQPAHLNLISFDKPYFGWVLRNVRRVEPIPFRGSLGLMTIPAETFRGRAFHD